jgi:hypothetical protein
LEDLTLTLDAQEFTDVEEHKTVIEKEPEYRELFLPKSRMKEKGAAQGP